MAKRMSRKLPFWIIPAHWGLSGKAKEIAKVNYHFEGYEADIRLAPLTYLTEYEIDKALAEIDVKYNKIKELEFDLKVLDIDLKYKRITSDEHALKVIETRYKHHDMKEYDYDSALIELMPDGDEKRVAAIEFAFKYHEITEREYSKEMFTMRKEPWMDFGVEFNEDSNEVEFSFDYNEYFWKKLKAEGHPGNDEYEIIDNFIKDWGRKLEGEEYLGDEDVDLTRMTDELPENLKFYK